LKRGALMHVAPKHVASKREVEKMTVALAGSSGAVATTKDAFASSRPVDSRWPAVVKISAATNVPPARKSTG